MAGSRWQGQVDAIRRQLPQSTSPRIEGFLTRYIDPVEPGRIAALASDCAGYSHSLDGQFIDFDPPIEVAELSEPWSTLRLGTTMTIGALLAVGPWTWGSTRQAGSE